MPQVPSNIPHLRDGQGATARSTFVLNHFSSPTLINMNQTNSWLCGIILLLSSPSLFAQVDWLTQSYETYTGTTYEGKAVGNMLDTDPANNVYVTGQYDGLTTFDTAAIADGLGPVFLAKFGPDGVVQWVSPVDGNSNNKSQALAVNSQGDAFIAGEYRHTNASTILNFGPFSLTGNNRFSGFLAKCNTDGTFQWGARILASTDAGSFVSPIDMAITPNGDLVVMGHLENPVEIEGQLYNQTNEREGLFLARFDTTGSLLWFKNSESGGPFSNIEGEKLAIGSAGQLYINGSFSGEPVWGTDTLLAPESADQFLARFDADGNLEWYRSQQARGVGQTPGQFGVDDQDNVYLSLRRGGGDLIFDDVTLSSTNYTGRYILLKYDAQGNRVFIKSFVRAGAGAITSGIIEGSLRVHSASDGELFLSGAFASASSLMPYLVFGEQDSFPMPNILVEQPVQFILNLNNDGNYRDVALPIDEYLTAPTSDLDLVPKDFIQNQQGKLLMTGEFIGSYRLGTDTLQTVSTLDQLFLMQLDPDALFDTPTSLDNQLLASQLHLYPNPARHTLHFSIQNQSVSSPVRYKLFQMNGSLLRSGTAISPGRIDIRSLPSGFYTLIVMTGNKQTSRKVLITE